MHAQNATLFNAASTFPATHGELSLRDVLTIEDDDALLALCVTPARIPVWSQIRVVLLRMIMSDLLYGTTLTSQSTGRVSRAKAASTMVRSLVHNAIHGHLRTNKATVCVMGDGVANQWVDGRWTNRLTDPFVDVLPERTVVVEDHFEWRWPFPRKHPNVLFHAPFQAMNVLRGKLDVREHHRKDAVRIVDLAAERGTRFLDWKLDDVRRARLVDMLAAKMASMPTQYQAYRKLLCRIEPRLLLVGAGCYGPAASLIAAARSLGIVTAEYQHGAVSSGHDAYNFAPALLNSEAYRRTLPDYFLSFGNWWGQQFNAPVRKISIGSPHRARQLEHAAAPATPAQRDTLLILSDGVDFDLYLDLATRVLPAASRAGLKVALRPHPLERTKVGQLTNIPRDRIEIDVRPNIYGSLARSRVVVSEVSTVLFEAIGIADAILIWDTPKARFAYPEHPFSTFASPDDLTALLDSGAVDRLQPDVPSGEIWQDGWEARYAQFITLACDSNSGNA
ncbi:hypothetical protein [Pandoraea sp. CB10b_02]|uniref:hypothetical protein n=1 Tax=Pandoraea sp. CB10b_02 TaxID=2014535 RepID=UPI0025811B88|nr:hypothetical protein [Pandoraea sp. CB10b_02]